MKAVPFIKTMLNEKYRLYVSEEFNHLIIADQFQDWSLKDMVGWHKLLNYNTDIQIEFFGKGNPYKIKNPSLVNGGELTLPYPTNLDQFICDCERCLVPLEWEDSILFSMDRVCFMEQSKIKNYNKEILTKIEKQ